MRRWLFNFGYLAAAAVIWPWFLYKAMTTGKYRAGIGQRLGRIPARRPGKSIWVHAVSVGELLQIKPLLKALREQHPEHEVVLTYTTKTAAEIAARDLPDVYHCYSPLDLSWVVDRFFQVLDPALVVLVELELWPNWLITARSLGVPVLVANGRISAGSFANYRRFAWLLRPAFDAIRVWAIQDEVYAERAKALSGVNGAGAPCVVVTGNLKYDSLRFEPDAEMAAYFRAAFNFAPGRPVLVCGSTHPGEHEMIVDMIPRLDCRVIIVPRHPERHESVREMLRKAALPWANRSMLSPERPAGERDVIVLDTVGELAAVYAVADVVFVGGSLIPHGGQNMAEPVALGKPTLVGPHTDNFRATVRELIECGGLVVVATAQELEARARDLLANADSRARIAVAGRARLMASRGALKRTLSLIQPLPGKSVP